MHVKNPAAWRLFIDFYPYECNLFKSFKFQEKVMTFSWKLLWVKEISIAYLQFLANKFSPHFHILKEINHITTENQLCAGEYLKLWLKGENNTATPAIYLFYFPNGPSYGKNNWKWMQAGFDKLRCINFFGSFSNFFGCSNFLGSLVSTKGPKTAH